MQRPIASDFKRGRESFIARWSARPSCSSRSWSTWPATADVEATSRCSMRSGTKPSRVASRFRLRIRSRLLPSATLENESAPRPCVRSCSMRPPSSIECTAPHIDFKGGACWRSTAARCTCSVPCSCGRVRRPFGWALPQVLVTVLFDVIAKLPVDAVIAPYASDERAQLGRLLPSTRKATSSCSIVATWVTSCSTCSSNSAWTSWCACHEGATSPLKSSRGLSADADVTPTPAPAPARARSAARRCAPSAASVQEGSSASCSRASHGVSSRANRSAPCTSGAGRSSSSTGSRRARLRRPPPVPRQEP